MMMPALLLAFTIVVPNASMAAEGGNSAAAHACQKGGYLDLYRTDHTAFANAGECTSYDV